MAKTTKMKTTKQLTSKRDGKSLGTDGDKATKAKKAKK